MISIQSYLKHLDRKLRLPYPEKASLLKEMESNYLQLLDSLLARGVHKGEAIEQSLKAVSVGRESKNNLEEIHNNGFYKTYWGWSVKQQEQFEILIGMMPLIVVSNFLIQEVPMMDLIRQGGVAMYPIILLGIFALLIQLKVIFSWFVARNHSEHSLGSKPIHALYLGAGCFLLGLFGTLMGLYQSFHYVNGIEDPDRFQRVLAMGVSESIVSIIFATGFLLLIVALHFSIKTIVEVKKIPARI